MSTRRALVFAGGGLKVAYQAGALQVLLDEVDDADFEFDYADGASAGMFNLAMWCEGLSGTEIADHWRRLSPGRYLWVRIGWPLFSFRRFRKNVFRDWGIDPVRIRRADNATFNLFDVKRQALAIKRADEMTEDLLVGCVALPGWFPAVETQGTTFVDAVFVTDGNLEQVLADGANELWVIWTVSRSGRLGRWPGGTFFQTVEQTANGRLKLVERRIERSNEAGDAGEFKQEIELRILYGEVSCGYLFVFTRGQLRRAVEQGVRETRAWCRLNNFPLKEPADRPLGRPTSFTELLTGEVRWGEISTPWKLAADVTARIAAIDEFVLPDGRRARATGTVHCEELGGTLPIEDGEVDVFVHPGDSGPWLIAYRLSFRDSSGRPLALVGEKRITGNLWHIWRETTTVEDVRLLDGQTELASGTLKLSPLQFLKTLAALARDTVWLPWLLPGRLASGRYLWFFGSELWRLYRPRLRGRTPVGEESSAS